MAAAGAPAPDMTMTGGLPAIMDPGMPGPFPGRVVGIEHPGCIVGGNYQAEPIRKMMEKGMTTLTGAPAWTDAWRSSLASFSRCK